MSAYSGWGGRVTVSDRFLLSTLHLPVARWSVVETVELVDVTSTRNIPTSDSELFTIPSHLKSYTLGYAEITASFDCFHDTGVVPFRPEVALVPGERLSVKLFTSRAPAEVWYFPTFIVESIQMDDEVRGVVKYTVSGKVNRIAYRPGYSQFYVPEHFANL